MNKKAKLIVSFGLSMSLIGSVALGAGITLYQKHTQAKNKDQSEEISPDQPITSIQTNGTIDDKITQEASYKAVETNESALNLINKSELAHNTDLYLASHSIQPELDSLAARKVNRSNKKIIEADVSSYFIDLFNRNDKKFSVYKNLLLVKTAGSSEYLSVSISASYYIKNDSEKQREVWINNRKFSINSKTTLELLVYTDKNPSFLKKATVFLDDNNRLNWSMDRVYFTLRSIDGSYTENWSLDNLVFNKNNPSLNVNLRNIKRGYTEYDAIKNFVGENKKLNASLNESILKDSLRRNYEDQFNLAKQYAGYIYHISKWMIQNRSEPFNVSKFIVDNASTISEVLIYTLEQTLKNDKVKILKSLIYDLLTSSSANNKSKTLFRIVLDYKDRIINFLSESNLVNITPYRSLIDNFFNSITETNPKRAENELRDKIIDFLPTIKELIKEDSPFAPYLDLLSKILKSPKPYFIDSIIKDPVVFNVILDFAYNSFSSSLDIRLKEAFDLSKQAIYSLLMDNNTKSFNDILINFFNNDFQVIFAILNFFNIKIDINNPATKFLFDNFVFNNDSLKDQKGLENVVSILSDLIELISPENLSKITFIPLNNNQTNRIEFISTFDELKIANLSYGYSLNFNNLAIKNSTIKKIINLIPTSATFQSFIDRYVTQAAINDAADKAVEEAKKASGLGVAIYGNQNLKNEVVRNINTLKDQLAKTNIKQLVTELLFGKLNFDDEGDFINLNGSIDISIKGNNIQVLPYYEQNNGKTLFNYQLLGITKEINLANLVNNSQLIKDNYENSNQVIQYQNLSKKLFAVTRSFFNSLKETLNHQPIRIIDNLVLDFSNKIYLDQSIETNKIVKNAYDPKLLIRDQTTKPGLEISKQDATANWNTTDNNNIIIDQQLSNKFNNLIHPIGIQNRYLIKSIKPFSTGELKASLGLNFNLTVILFPVTIPLNLKIGIEQRILSYDLIAPYNVADDLDNNNVVFVNKVSKHWENTLFKIGA
ncbi:hypothetical protein LNO75_02900 [Mycoplasma sp. T363T]|uniref:P97/LppS family protein n=1 Tax=Mycoplasma bradburyae TaxID=2963128 RepID=A0AAW6HRS7_9MOLU|nr:hypothetical protein [Mycoplasma bradburyae]MDC4163520.1 hypothetical protein [Mycoplasma bradburyae]MDC4182118.1 hypothetical protein [Mycoplasma bradburyae]MDC4183566.1 hypothetical protein [Mycoplasma bradburyae]UTS70313.1 hypothetical protein NMG68_01035 [Mycoplasma bradburyae]UTS71036.1 hypothetical protein NMG77_01020 [Mycoplasma bradburyae]